MSNSPVVVNFNVVIDANSNLTIFGTEAPQVNNAIVSEVGLPVTALFNESLSKGLIEFWESDASENLIMCQLADSSLNANYTGAYKHTAKQLAKGLARLLCGRFDCSDAVPFSGYKSNVEYYKQRDFGRVALGAIAQDLFGHVDATAAITNDLTFIKNMLSIDSDVDASAEYDPALTEIVNANTRFATWKKRTMVDASDVGVWDDAQSPIDANLAVALVKAILNKGLLNGAIEVQEVNSATIGQLAYIANQVLGQDATRMMGHDNSARTKNVHQLLKFVVGDTIYMNIKVAKPALTVGTNTPAQQTIAGGLDLKSLEHNFTLKIVLTNDGYIPELGA
jgi:hypothetical protein